MNIFITGGTGFIGSYVVYELLKHNHTLTILARNPEKVRGFVQHKQIQFIKGSLSDHERIKEGLAGQDACIHIALGWGDTAVSMFESDTKHSIVLFESAAKQKIKQIIYTSSTMAAGDLRPFMDKNIYTRPTDFYSATKAATEGYLLAISQVYRIKCNIIRPGYTFGNPVCKGAPMQPDNRFKMIVNNAKTNKNITLIKNDGTQFIWAGYLAQLFHHILTTDYNRMIFYGLGPDFITWEDIADKAIHYTGSKSKIIFIDKGWEKGACMYDSRDVIKYFGNDINILIRRKLDNHIEYIADNPVRDTK